MSEKTDAPSQPVSLFRDEWEVMQGVIDSVGEKLAEDAKVSPHVRRAAANFLFLMEQASNYLLGTVDPVRRSLGKDALEARAPLAQAAAQSALQQPAGDQPSVVQFPVGAKSNG